METLALSVAAFIIALAFLGIGFGLGIDRAYHYKMNRLVGALCTLFLVIVMVLAVSMPPLVILWPIGGLLIGFFLAWVL